MAGYYRTILQLGNGLERNLVGCYNLDGNANDSSGNGNNGTGFGSLGYTTGKIGLAPLFDSNSKYISIADNIDFTFSQAGADIPFSISLWVYFTAFNTVGNWLVNKRENTATTDEWQLAWINTGAYVGFTKFTSTMNNVRTQMNAVLSTGQWYHIVFTCNTGPYGKFYLNGVQQPTTNVPTGTYTGMSNTTAPVTIGRAGWGLTNANHLGLIDLVGIWKGRELTKNDVLRLYNNGNGLIIT